MPYEGSENGLVSWIQSVVLDLEVPVSTDIPIQIPQWWGHVFCAFIVVWRKYWGRVQQGTEIRSAKNQIRLKFNSRIFRYLNRIRCVFVQLFVERLQI